MEFSEKVLVLHVGKFKEADIWIRFLSPTRGVLSAFAFGGSRSRKRFVGCLDLFNQVLFRVQATSRGAYLCLQEGILIDGPKRLRTDWSRMGIANNCAKFLQAFGVTPEGATSAYQLFLEVLQVLEEKDTISSLLPFFFRLRLAFGQGYSIRLDGCGHCNQPLDDTDAAFYIREGLLLCDDCAKFYGERGVALSKNALAALCCVGLKPLWHWDKVALDGKEKNNLAKAVDGFIQFHVGLTWDNGRFYRR